MSETRQRVVPLMHALRRLPPLKELTGDEERLFFDLLALLDRNQVLTISHALAVLAEQPKDRRSLRRRIGRLEAKGILQFYGPAGTADHGIKLSSAGQLVRNTLVAVD